MCDSFESRGNMWASAHSPTSSPFRLDAQTAFCSLNWPMARPPVRPSASNSSCYDANEPIRTPYVPPKPTNEKADYPVWTQLHPWTHAELHSAVLCVVHCTLVLCVCASPDLYSYIGCNLFSCILSDTLRGEKWQKRVKCLVFVVLVVNRWHFLTFSPGDHDASCTGAEFAF